MTQATSPAAASLSAAQIIAMQRLYLHYGRHWKSYVAHGWQSGVYDIFADSEHLDALHHKLGTAWLDSYTLPAIDLDAAPLATYPPRPYGPLRCRAFHGTRSRFDQFRVSATGALGPGIYLADRSTAAWEYGPLVLEVDVALSNPFVFRPSDESIAAINNPELIEQVLPPRVAMRVAERLHENDEMAYGDEVQEALCAHGFDGVLMLFPEGTPVVPVVDTACVILAFDPAQVCFHRVDDLGECNL